MTTSRYLTDAARANWSSLVAVTIGVGAALLIILRAGGFTAMDPAAIAVSVYLFTWPSFGLIYLVWTHVAYSRSGVPALRARARREREAQRRWWSSLLGYGGASGWTMSAALVAILVTFAVAQDATYRSDPLYVTLGLLSVASSWALMVYAFALQYLRLGLDDASDSTRHIDIGLDDEPRFGDYLTLAVLLSTMAATVSATIRTREAWTLVRTNVLFAFAFNSVIVAMVVSLLVGGFVG